MIFREYAKHRSLAMMVTTTSATLIINDKKFQTTFRKWIQEQNLPSLKFFPLRVEKFVIENMVL